MTNGLRDLLHEYADEARSYDVRIRALAAGRRRRTLRRLAPAAVALVILSGFAVVNLIEPRPAPDQPVTLEPILRDPIALGGFPARIVPADSPPPLPADRAVGPAAFIYDNPNQQTIVLVTVDGSQYLLDPDSTMAVYSPDGRWLASTDHAGASTHIRDLESTAQTDVPGSFYAWSPDSDWLVTATGGGPNLVSATVVLLDYRLESHTVDLTPFPGRVPVSVRGDGQVVLSTLDSGDRLEVSTVDRFDSRVELRPWLTDDELQAKLELDQRSGSLGRSLQNMSFVDDARVLLQVPARPKAGFVGSTVLVIDLIDERVVERISLPTPRGAGRDLESWLLLRQWHDSSPGGRSGLLLLRHNSTQLLAVELYRPDTRELFPVTDLTGLPRAPTTR